MKKKIYVTLTRYLSSSEFSVSINNWHGEGLRCFVLLSISTFCQQPFVLSVVFSLIHTVKGRGLCQLHKRRFKFYLNILSSLIELQAQLSQHLGQARIEVSLAMFVIDSLGWMFSTVCLKGNFPKKVKVSFEKQLLTRKKCFVGAFRESFEKIFENFYS